MRDETRRASDSGCAVFAAPALETSSVLEAPVPVDAAQFTMPPSSTPHALAFRRLRALEGLRQTSAELVGHPRRQDHLKLN